MNARMPNPGAASGLLCALLGSVSLSCNSSGLLQGDAAGVAGAGGGGGGAGGTTSTGGAGAGGSGGTAGASGGAGGGTSCTDPPAPSPLIGWASMSGMGQTAPTSGGGDTAPTIVSNANVFTAAIGGTAARVVYVTGTLTGSFDVGSNKTIVGLCGGTIHGHLGLSRSSNVIVRNLNIVGYGVGDCTLDPSFDPTVGCSSGEDAVTIQNGSHHVWFDHCDISDGTDGNLDVTSGSDFVTISWTKFHYTPRTDMVGNDSTGAEGHRFSNLIGSADNVPGDVGHLNITWHHDWWADNVNQRMPRSRYGQIHMLNNLFTSTGDSYCTNAGLMASLLVEGNAYIGVRTPLSPDANGNMLAPAGSNLFMNTSGRTTGNGTGFTPPYPYTPDATGTLAAAIMSGAGPH